MNVVSGSPAGLGNSQNNMYDKRYELPYLDSDLGWETARITWHGMNVVSGSPAGLGNSQNNVAWHESRIWIPAWTGIHQNNIPEMED